MLRSAPRLRRGALLIRGPSIIVMGPGSAKHRFALHRVRDTRHRFLKYSITNNAYYEMASRLDAR
jgi:hypothetical protein